MTILGIGIAACLLIWACVLLRYRSWDLVRMTQPPTLAAFSVWVGSVFGYEFWHLSFGPIPLTLDRIIWGCLMAQFLWLLIRGAMDWKPIRGLDIAVGLLFLTLTISTLTHDYSYRDSMPLSRLLFFNWMPFGLYLVLRRARVDRRQLRWILGGFSILGIYLAVTAIAEWRGLTSLVYPRYIMSPEFAEFFGRARGPFLNPVVCGTFLTVGFFSLFLFWCRRGTWGKSAIGLAWGLFLVAVFATSTRSVWMAFVLSVATLVWLITNTRQRGVILIGMGVAVCVVLMFFGEHLNSFKRDRYVTESDMAESVALRPLLAEVAAAMVKDRPIFGHGFGQYTKAKRLYHQQATTSPLKKVIPYMQHNVLLSYLTETGAWGCGLLLTVLVLLGRQFWQLTRRGLHRDLEVRMVGWLGLAILAAYAINGTFHDVSIMPMIGSLFYFFAGLGASLTQQQRQLEILDAHEFVTPLHYRLAS